MSNKLDQEKKETIQLRSALAITILGELQDKVSAMRNLVELPDYSELQDNKDTEKLGYRIEDAEVAMANISQEVQDAIMAFEGIINNLNNNK